MSVGRYACDGEGTVCRPARPGRLRLSTLTLRFAAQRPTRRICWLDSRRRDWRPILRPSAASAEYQRVGGRRPRARRSPCARRTSCWPPSTSYVAPVRAVLVVMCTASWASRLGIRSRMLLSAAVHRTCRATSACLLDQRSSKFCPCLPHQARISSRSAASDSGVSPCSTAPRRSGGSPRAGGGQPS
jgi:hypothetical protein